jgi:hypothetical protein
MGWDRKKWKRALFSAAGGTLFLLPGFVIAAYSLHQFHQFRGISQWEQTDGVILEAELQQRLLTHSEQGSRVRYHVALSYAYEVNGRHFTGRRIAYGAPANYSGSKAAQYTKRYPPGQKVTVFYNPKAPDIAVLERNLEPHLMVYAFSGLLWLGIPILIALARWRNRRVDQKLRRAFPHARLRI